MRAIGRLIKQDRGAALIISAIGVLVLALLAALAIDLGALRNERSAGQKAVDAAATSAVFDVGDNDPVAACETALASTALNVPNTASFAGTNCNLLPPTCDDTTPAATTSGTAGEVTVTITYPVPDSSTYMDAGAIGAGPQAVVAADGEQCQRFAVAASIERETFFARLMGIDTQTTEVHAVAKVISGNDRQATVALLLLERTDCDVLTANGNGGVAVGSVVDPDTGELLPGQIALDTSATGSCGSAMETKGGPATIIADGPPGCPGELPGPPAGQGCGETRVFGASGPGCAPPICSSGAGTIAPLPTSMSRRITREPLDHLYNCKPSYPASYDIDGCLEGEPAHIDNLVAAIGPSGTPVGWSSYTGAGHSCNLQTDTVLPAGNWHIDCPSLSVKARLDIQGGVVFDGDVSITASGVLAVNAIPPVANSVVAF
ncbi:MAG: pilus assembly protein TadG-related protein, partial [Acidimicrobiia bacterium]